MTMPRVAMLDGKAEGGASDRVDDQVVGAGEPFHDISGTKATEESCDAVAHQCADEGALTGELDRESADASVCAGDEHALAEYQAGDLERPERSSQRWAR